jgi:hypothetical protein
MPTGQPVAAAGCREDAQGGIELAAGVVEGVGARAGGVVARVRQQIADRERAHGSRPSPSTLALENSLSMPMADGSAGEQADGEQCGFHGSPVRRWVADGNTQPRGGSGHGFAQRDRHGSTRSSICAVTTSRYG